MKQFFLIDGFAFLYRAYYAFPEMKNAEGMNVNAVYGFFRMMLKRFVKKPDFFVIAWDSQEKTFRHQQHEEYKANRKKMEDDFKNQIPLIHQIIEELGIPFLAVPGYEADDILASLIWKYKKESDVSLYLYSADKDLKQVLDENVFIVDPVKDSLYQKKDFITEFWFNPIHIVDYLALLGDAADNIKGVNGIGEKKALSLVQQFQTVENMYEHLDDMEETVANILRNQKEIALFSKSMIQLMDVDLGQIVLEDLKFSLDYEKFISVLWNKYSFVSLEKLLLEMKKEAEKPQQLGLF